MPATQQPFAERQRYLRQKALTRLRCDNALADGYAIDPDYAEHAANELLLRAILPLRKHRLTEHIIPITEEDRGLLAILEPHDRWAEVQARHTGM